MRRMILAVVGYFLLAAVPLHAEQKPQLMMQLQPARWRAVRHIIQHSADQTGFRWAMPDTINRRAWSGVADGKLLPVESVVEDTCKQTGLTAELLNKVLLFHVPRSAKRQELLAQLAGKDRRLQLQAVVELGWLPDARAWPELAKVAVGDDLELALAAAQALRRLDGEKTLDWRLFGVTQEDPEFVPMTTAVTPWQAPLGMAFPDAVPLAAVEKLTASTYIPLREAAARLAACQSAKGKAVVEQLAKDASPLVRAAAERTLPGWAEPQKPGPKAVKKPDGQKPWYEQPAPDLKAAAEELAKNKDHDTVWRLAGRRVAYQGTPAAIQVMLDYGKSGGKWSSHVTQPLAEWCGGPEVAAWLKLVASKPADYGNHQGWALWALSSMQDGEELARSLQAALESRAYWSSPPEYTAARGAGIHALKPLLARLESRGHWVCLALGHIGGPEATEILIANLNHKDPGVAVAAAKGLGDSAAHAGIKPLIGQLKNPDRLRRHWAVLGLGRIGGPDAVQALTELLVEEEKRQDRLVRKAAAELLKEMGPLSRQATALLVRVESDDKALVPEYRPRNTRFDDSLPVNTEVVIKEFKPPTYSSIGETRAALDWANKLMLRYGGCSPCYSNECFGFDVGTMTWFPIRAADHFCHLFNEVRPIPGCTRGMTYDGVHKLTWIGHGIGSYSGPTAVTHNQGNCLSGYDVALDRFYPCANAPTMAKAYSGEPAKYFTFDYDQGLVVSSASGGKGVGLLDAKTRQTYLAKAPEQMPSWDQYRPPALAYDPIDRAVMCTHPDLQWKLLRYDLTKHTYRLTDEAYPGKPSKGCMGGLVYDSLNREMILIGGIDRETKLNMPTCRWDRQNQRWVDLEAKELGKLGVGQGTCVFDPEHNVIIDLISGAVYRYKSVATGTKAYYGGGIGQRN